MPRAQRINHIAVDVPAAALNGAAPVPGAHERGPRHREARPVVAVHLAPAPVALALVVAAEVRRLAARGRVAVVVPAEVARAVLAAALGALVADAVRHGPAAGAEETDPRRGSAPPGGFCGAPPAGQPRVSRPCHVPSLVPCCRGMGAFFNSPLARDRRRARSPSYPSSSSSSSP